MEQLSTQEREETQVSAIMPELPDSSAPELTAADRLAVFLASAAQRGGRLAPSAWKQASDLLHAVFSSDDSALGEARRRSEQRVFLLQSRFHAALLQPAAPLSCFVGDARLTSDLAALAPEKAALFIEGVAALSPEHAEVLRALSRAPEAGEQKSASWWNRSLRLIPGRGAWEEMFGEGEAAERDDTHAVVMENGVAQPRRKERALLPEPWKRQLGDFSAKMNEAGSACGNMAGDAARYLRELDLQRLFAVARRDEGKEVAAPLTKTLDAADALRDAALSAGAVETARATDDLRRLMMEQPYTLVVVGEGKRGKSSLVNALLGAELSPVRESVPETTAVVRFRWGREFRASIRFLDEQECQHLEQFSRLVAPASDDSSFEERMRRRFEERPPQESRIIKNREELSSFLSAGSGDSLFSARAEVETPSEILRQGLTLVDTPGLNATDPVQNYLAYEESLAADCLLFVMDARRPESSSELELMRQLARSGRAASVIGVVTGSDRLNEEASRENALARARLMMDAASAEGMEVLGLVEVNAREVMRLRCSGKTGTPCGGFDELCRIIAEASASRKEEDEARLARLRERGAELAATVRREAGLLLESERAELPDERHAELLRRHVERLEEVMSSCSSQAWSVANSASLDMDAWRKEQERALDNWQERTILRIMDAANKHADSLGFPAMFKPKNWKKFDEEDVPRIARDCLEELLEERRDIQHDWNEKIRQFGERMHEISVLCFEAVVGSEEELRSISDVPFNSERWLVNANSAMKKIGLVAMGLAIRRGGGLGLGIVLGNMGWWALLPVAVVGSLVWTLMKLGSPSRCRRLIMERKEEAVRKWAAEQRKRLDDVLNENLEDISRAYHKAVSEGFLPALSVLAEEASALRVYLGVLDKMRLGAEAQAEAMTARAVKLEKELALLA